MFEPLPQRTMGQRRQPSSPSSRPLRAVRGRTRAAALAVAVALVSAVLAVLAPAASAGVCTPDPLLCPQRIYVGASVPDLPGDPAALGAFTAATGVSPSVAMYFY